MGKLRLTITGEIQKENGLKFNEKENEDFTDDLLTFLEENGFVFIGIIK